MSFWASGCTIRQSSRIRVGFPEAKAFNAEVLGERGDSQHAVWILIDLRRRALGFHK